MSTHIIDRQRKSQPTPRDGSSDSAAAIARDRNTFGLVYGVLAGGSFAVCMWGLDAIQLAQLHALFPWLKLLVGIVLCAVVVGLAAWIAVRIERPGLSFLVWLGAIGMLAWISVAVPLQITPSLAQAIEPDLSGFIHYATGEGFVARFWIALAWIGIFMSITGVLQTTLVDTAVFSASLFGKIFPFLACIILAGLGGIMLDDMINVPFRKALAAVEAPVQFLLDHRGQVIDPVVSRQFHAGALRGVREEITSTRQLFVGEYDESFVLIDVLVRFDNAWVVCITVNGQASFCKLAESKP
jgi:hypothetical protein